MQSRNPKFAYLDNHFAERRSPSATRIHYALASTEDNIVQGAVARVEAVAESAAVMTYLFDGFVARVKASEIPPIRDALLTEGTLRGVTFTVDEMPTDIEEMPTDIEEF